MCTWRAFLLELPNFKFAYGGAKASLQPVTKTIAEILARLKLKPIQHLSV